MEITQTIVDEFKNYVKDHIKNDGNNYNFTNQNNRLDRVGRDISKLTKPEFNPDGNYALFFLMRSLLSISPKELVINGNRFSQILIDNKTPSVKLNFDGNKMIATAIENSIGAVVPLFIERYFRLYLTNYIGYVKNNTSASLDHIAEFKNDLKEIIKQILNTDDMKSFMGTYINSLGTGTLPPP